MRMIKRHAHPALMAGDTELLVIVTFGAIKRVAGSIESVRENIIQIVNRSGEVVPPMTGDTGILGQMALLTPLRLEIRPITVTVDPADRMNIGDHDPALMTGFTIGFDILLIVTGDTLPHIRIIRYAYFLAGNHRGVADLTGEFFCQMFFMIK